jgi:thiol-disulfide isomerase/thioredoxin
MCALWLVAFAAGPDLVTLVQDALNANALPAAERVVRQYRTSRGVTPELAAAVSWLGRGSLAAKDYAQAEQYAAQAREMALGFLTHQPLDRDPLLPLALGASIEVRAQALAAQGRRAEAVAFLREQLNLYGRTSMAERIQKNMNLLGMEGKRGPVLRATDWVSGGPGSGGSPAGHPTLLFFWAHWCPDCKAEAPILGRLLKKYGAKGFAMVAPTKYYGYVAGGEDAVQVLEKRYIGEVWRQYYSMLGNVPVPVSAAGFSAYGASTTPTLVLLDAAGIVRMYHPGAMPENELAARIEAVLAR